jgi:predicted nicotinamide N-methyase
VLAGDVFYDKTMAERITPFLGRARGTVLTGVADRACTYLPRPRFEQVAVHDVPAPLEDSATKRTFIWRYIRTDR